MNIINIKKFFSLEEPNNFNSEVIGDNKKLIHNNDGNNNENTKNIHQYISKILEQNESYIRNVFSNCSDLQIREISLFNLNKGKVLIVYLNELTAQKMVDDAIISRLTLNKNIDIDIKDTEETIKYALGIKNEDIYEELDKCVKAIIDGNVVVFVDMLNKAFLLNLKSPPERSIEEPTNDTAVRGPREGFTESIVKNISLIRKIIKSPNLKTERFIVGKETNTDLAICYLSNLADESIVEEVKSRIRKINLNSVIGSNYVLECIEDDVIAFVPTVYRTERPDTAASKIMEGKVVIIVDGSPVVISVPALFIEFMQSTDDYYLKYIPVTFNRWLRFIGVLLTLTLPGIYVSVLDFHQELVPTALVISIIKSRSGIPLPAVWECFLMLLAYDIIREAGIRVPRNLSQTISIVGALILGEAAVRAGIVGATTIIIVAFAGTALFVIPSVELNTSMAVIKYILLFLSGIFGIFGLVCGILFLSMYMVSRRSFGVPYMYPLAPLNFKRNQDTFIRVPVWKLNEKYKIFKK